MAQPRADDADAPVCRHTKCSIFGDASEDYIALGASEGQSTNGQRGIISLCHDISHYLGPPLYISPRFNAIFPITMT